MINLKNMLKGIRRPSLFPILVRQIFPWEALKNDPECRHIIKSWSSGSLPRVTLPSLFPGIEKCDILIRSPYGRVIGWSPDLQELTCILSIVKFIGATKVLEIGTYDGFATLNLAASIGANGVVCTVDLPPESAKSVPRKRISNACAPSILGSKFKDQEESRKIRQVFGDSTKLNWSELGGPFDLIFIDGCHEYPYIDTDTENAIQSISQGGVIIWHDYGHFPDVSQAVDRMARTCDIVAVKGTRLAVHWSKPKS